MPLGVYFFVVLAWLACCSASAKDTVNRYTVSTAKPFEDVVDDLKFAISDHNFRITGNNRIGAGIAEREGIAFPRASVFEFCNLRYARQLLEYSPSYLLHMPCRIAVYEQGEQTIVDAYLLSENDPRISRIIQEVNQIIKSIVRYAVE